MKVSKEEKREHILHVATMFFSSSRYQNTDVQKIADTAGVGKGISLFFIQRISFFAAIDRAIVEIEKYKFFLQKRVQAKVS